MKRIQSIHLKRMAAPVISTSVISEIHIDRSHIFTNPELKIKIIDGERMPLNGDGYKGPSVDVSGRLFDFWTVAGFCLVVTWKKKT